MEKLLNVTEVASVLKVHIMSLYGMVRDGKIPFLKIGGRLRFREDDIRAWLENKNQGPATDRKSGNAGR